MPSALFTTLPKSSSAPSVTTVTGLFPRTPSGSEIILLYNDSTFLPVMKWASTNSYTIPQVIFYRYIWKIIKKLKTIKIIICFCVLAPQCAQRGKQKNTKGNYNYVVWMSAFFEITDEEWIIYINLINYENVTSNK